MTTGQAIALVCMFLAVDLVVVGAVVAWAATTVREFAAAFPARAAGAGAVSRRWQGISIGMMNFGWSFTLTADEECLHFEPVWVLRRAGVARASVPWGAMTRTTKPGWRWWVGVRAGSFELKLPRWCEPMLEAGEGA